ncbi:hypothetical protein MBANPS3_004608 [Mucor bainieri]
MPSQALFSPIKIGAHTLKHRVVLPPLTRLRATPEAVPTDLQAEYYEQRATDGGLMIAEATFISRLAGAYPQAPGIYNKEQIEGWKKVTSAVHAKGAVIFLQLWHVGRVGSKQLNPNQEQVVSASDIPCPGDSLTGYPHEVPRALSIDEIKSIVGEYAQAAKNGIEAGFDGIEVHAANGYLVDQFINDSSNSRTDIYGGSVENRGRFALEIVDAIAAAVGEERTAIRFSPGLPTQGMATNNVEETWGYLASELQKNHPGLAYLHMIEGRTNHNDSSQVNTTDILGSYRQIWKGPFISAGGFSTSLEFGHEIAEQTGDLLAYGRAFVANPDLPERLRNGWELNRYDRDTFYRVDVDTGLVLNLYWGSRLVTFTDIDLDNKLAPERSSQDPAITSAKEEFPVFGGLRYGPDLLRIQFESNKTRELDLVYKKGELDYDETELVIVLEDKVHTGCRVLLRYRLDIESDLIIRSSTIIATGEETLVLTKAHTAAWHVPPPASSCQRELTTLAGAWAAETQVQTHSLEPGTSQVLQSTRGIPSAQAYPYFAVKDQVSDGEHNDCEVYFGSLGWSGNWAIELHTDIQGNVAITGGMNDRDFKHQLNNTRFELPEFVAGFTVDGLSGARKCLTNHIRSHKDRSLVKNPEQVAPVLYNGWEAYDFRVTFENQKEMAQKAANLGAELFVLDDGWFHKRDSDNAGLGDWFADNDKFPNGLKPLADHVHDSGMLFGLWFEPEMVNPDSDLYRKHPDWVYHYPDRTRHLERNQLVLNITKKEVQDYLLERIISTVKSVGVDYIKWDMNRPISEAGSQLGKAVWTEHVHAFYGLIRRVKEATGLVRIETCCSGGGRADLSILKKTESCWPSDNTRPDARIFIQYGASFIMPANSMSCWVTDSPNDDPFTNIPISYRFHVSFMGALGIGSNLNGLPDRDLEEYKGWISLYKELREVLQMGQLEWLVVPTSKPSAYTAVTQTSRDNAVVVLAFRQSSPFWLPLRPIRLRGLTACALYDVSIWSRDPKQPAFTGIMSGSALMNKGLDLPYLTSKAYSSVVAHLVQKA